MSGPVLLYDGLCGFCNATVQFILHHETRHTLRFSPLQGSFAAGLVERHPELNQVDSLVWVDGEGATERVKVRSAAAFQVASYLGRQWKLLLVAWLVPRVLRDALYDMLARHRFKFFGRYRTCPVPDRQVRARFLP